MASSFFLIPAVAFLLAAAALAFFLWRAHRGRAEDTGAALLAADAALEDLARDRGWALELHPSAALWYRLRGNSPTGVFWEIVEGPPSLVFGSVVGGGARWSTESIRSPQLLVEVLPAALYNRMQAMATGGGPWDPAWSVATKQVMAAGRVVPFEDAWVSERLSCVSIVPTVAQRLFSEEVTKAIAALRSATLKISLGMPNLRLSCDEGGGTPKVLPALVTAGVAVADRYRALEREFRKEEGAI